MPSRKRKKGWRRPSERSLVNGRYTSTILSMLILYSIIHPHLQNFQIVIPIACLFYILSCFKTQVKSHEIATYFYKVVNHLKYFIQALELCSSKLLLFSHILSLMRQS